MNYILPREFCRQWLYPNLSPNELIAKEESWGYKRRCCRLLASLLGVSESRVRHWGRGLEFPKIPSRHLPTLTILILHRQLLETGEQIKKRDARIAQLERQLERIKTQLIA